MGISQVGLGTHLMESETWVIYSKEANTPIWKSSNKKDLTRMLIELKTHLGDKFDIKIYKEKNEGTSK